MDMPATPGAELVRLPISGHLSLSGGHQRLRSQYRYRLPLNGSVCAIYLPHLLLKCSKAVLNEGAEGPDFKLCVDFDAKKHPGSRLRKLVVAFAPVRERRSGWTHLKATVGFRW